MGITLMISLIISTLARLSVGQDSPKDFVNAHNSARSKVGVGPIFWNETIAAYARDYANKLARGDCRLVHSNGSYGENLAWGSADLSGTEAVNTWVAEKFDYNYVSNSCASGKVCGHYTQVVWADSVRLGCAKVQCSDGGTFIGCNYDPPGNVIGQRPYKSTFSLACCFRPMHMIRILICYLIIFLL